MSQYVCLKDFRSEKREDFKKGKVIEYSIYRNLSRYDQRNFKELSKREEEKYTRNSSSDSSSSLFNFSDFDSGSSSSSSSSSFDFSGGDSGGGGSSGDW